MAHHDYDSSNAAKHAASEARAAGYRATYKRIVTGKGFAGADIVTWRVYTYRK